MAVIQPTPFDLKALLPELERLYGVPPGLGAKVLMQESGGDPNAVSPKGARGLMQVMPATARQPGFGVAPLTNIEDPQENLRFGVEYLGALLKHNQGDVPKALAAYNAGQGRVDRAGGVPPIQETQNYVAAITGGREPSPPETRTMPAVATNAMPIGQVMAPQLQAALPVADPFTGLPPSIAPGPPRNEVETAQRLSGWQKFLHNMRTNPEFQATALHFGTQLLQPTPAGQSSLGHVGRALQASANFLAATRAAEEERQKGYRQEGREERRLGSDIRRGEADIAQSEQAVKASQSTVGIAEAGAPGERAARAAQVEASRAATDYDRIRAAQEPAESMSRMDTQSAAREASRAQTKRTDQEIRQAEIVLADLEKGKEAAIQDEMAGGKTRPEAEASYYTRRAKLEQALSMAKIAGQMGGIDPQENLAAARELLGESAPTKAASDGRKRIVLDSNGNITTAK